MHRINQAVAPFHGEEKSEVEGGRQAMFFRFSSSFRTSNLLAFYDHGTTATERQNQPETAKTTPQQTSSSGATQFIYRFFFANNGIKSIR
jgi:hypothetical protein